VSLRARKMGSVVGEVREARQAAVQDGHGLAASLEGEGFVVGKVVGFAHEGVDRAHGVGLVLREDAEGVVEILGFPLGDGTAGGIGRDEFWRLGYGLG
jgi:hypothetical protein